MQSLDTAAAPGGRGSGGAGAAAAAAARTRVQRDVVPGGHHRAVLGLLEEDAEVHAVGRALRKDGKVEEGERVRLRIQSGGGGGGRAQGVCRGPPAGALRPAALPPASRWRKRRARWRCAAGRRARGERRPRAGPALGAARNASGSDPGQVIRDAWGRQGAPPGAGGPPRRSGSSGCWRRQPWLALMCSGRCTGVEERAGQAGWGSWGGAQQPTAAGGSQPALLATN